VAAVGLVGIATWSWAARPPDPRCATDVAAQWSGAVGADARRSFTATDLPYADEAFAGADADLRAYAEQWGDAHARACEAGDDRQLECLRAGRAAFEAVTDAFARADARTVEHAHATAAGLPALDACEPRTQPRPAAVERQLAEARAQLAIRDFDGARQTLAALARVVVEGGDDGLLAEVALLRAHAAHYSGDLDAAAEHARAAHYAAQTVGDDKTAAMSASLLVQIVGVDRNRPAEGGTWAGHARTAAARWGGGDADEGYFVLRLASFARAQRRFDEAVELSRKAVAILEPLARPLALADALTGLAVVLSDVGEFTTAIDALRRSQALLAEALPAGHPRYIEVLLSLGVNQISLGDTAAAEASWTEALRIAKQQGEDYYRLGFIEANLGGLLINTDRPDEAAPHLDRAIAVLTATFGPDHPSLAHPLQGLSSIHVTRAEYDQGIRLAERALVVVTAAQGEEHDATAAAKAHLAEAHKLDGNAEEAEALFRDALATMTRLLGPDHVRLAGLHTALADIARVDGDPAAARAHLDEAIRIVARVRGEDSPDLAYPLTVLGLVQVDEGELETAVATLQRGRALRSGGTPWERADSELALATALWDAGKRDAARAHADAALDLCRSDAPARCAADVNAWVATHGAA
jgi:tetratricopeptide (TPR) repeat protein